MKPSFENDDPVAAYDKLAPHYGELCRRREKYLRGVEREIVARIPGTAASLLDIGSGDGVRTRRIAAAAGIQRVFMVEPSAGMVSTARDLADIWRVRAQDLRPETLHERFDVITCLWNVLGHVPEADARRRALGAVATLLSPEGKFFADVNHRYNARSYGFAPTMVRWLRDRVMPYETNGDVVAEWNFGEEKISTYGHVFTDREVKHLTSKVGLQMTERIIIDYNDGAVRRFPWQGNLLYVLRRTSRMDSSSAPQTS